ncbi:MAG: hypothetical protein NXI32_23540, partial [bacterium]|nr:hypothetical protein [bacterium]
MRTTRIQIACERQARLAAGWLLAAMALAVGCKNNPYPPPPTPYPPATMGAAAPVAATQPPPAAQAPALIQAPTTGPNSVFAQQQTNPQLLDLQRRVQELDANNRQLTSQVAQ